MSWVWWHLWSLPLRRLRQEDHPAQEVEAAVHCDHTCEQPLCCSVGDIATAPSLKKKKKQNTSSEADGTPQSEEMFKFLWHIL